MLLKSAPQIATACDAQGYTALIWAITYGLDEIVNALLQNDAIDLEAADHANRRTPLIWASSHGHKNIVKALLEAGAKSDAVRPGLDELVRYRAAGQSRRAQGHPLKRGARGR